MAALASPLRTERDGAVAVLTLARPDRRNALSIELRHELAGALEAAAGDPDVGCVILTGEGPAFCSGMDTTQFGGDRANREAIVESSTRAFRALALCPKPTVAAVNGPALAGGFSLALLCDLRLAAEEATLGFVELARGIPPGYAAARAALPAAVAADLCLTGRTVGAAEARALGIVSEVCPAADLLPRALDVARGIAAAPRGAALETKRRMLMDAERAWLPLLEEEERALRAALLG